MTMQDIFGSVRRSLVVRTGSDGNGGVGGDRIVEKIGSCLRKSRIGLGLGFGGFVPKLPPPPPSEEKDNVLPILWRRGELIGCGAFGHVYMGMNLESGELLAVKQVLIGTSSASKEKAQAHIWELKEEVKLLKNLSHPNIVASAFCPRYLGITREEETLNILLEFVPGGSISSLLRKFGSFTEAVSYRMYTKQLLQGLDYLHQNGIMHRDIKAWGLIFLWTTRVASSWQILGHQNKLQSWLLCLQPSQYFSKLATINAAKSMKGTPYWMAPEVILQTGHSLEPKLRSSTSDLLQHPFVTKEFKDLHPMHHSDIWEPSRDVALTSKLYTKSINNDGDKLDKNENSSRNCSIVPGEFTNVKPIWELNNSSDMCRLDDIDDFPIVGSSFNPMSEPFDEWPPQKFDVSPEHKVHLDDSHEPVIEGSCTRDGGDDFAFSSEPVDDDEVTESKIRAFLDEKLSCFASGITALPADLENKASPGNCSRQESRSEEEDDGILREISPQLNEWGGLLQDAQPESMNPSFSERLSKWKKSWIKNLRGKERC
ncbi:hypothetical protein ZIOFF_003268 [Zingiber officinale]|uniref:mitogen-activated protein kinase kinase kinase n=1 Tax=Zingiber officinale TaxID=94328 RepID=A0A8J5MA27_ZINOF|nr:hypothetical protein ZIOFF_003268 [Zingiber officinale]